MQFESRDVKDLKRLCTKKPMEDKKGCAMIFVSTVVVSVMGSRGICLPLFLHMAVLNGTAHF